MIDHLNEPIETYQGAWLPEDEHSSAASMTMRTALRTSSNRAAVRVLESVGIERAVVRKESRRWHGAERAVSRAGFWRSHARLHDGSLRRIC